MAKDYMGQIRGVKLEQNAKIMIKKDAKGSYNSLMKYARNQDYIFDKDSVGYFHGNKINTIWHGKKDIILVSIDSLEGAIQVSASDVVVL